MESEQYFDCFSENSKCLSFLAMTSRKGRTGGAFNFLFNFPSTLIPLLLYFRISFGLPPYLYFAICKRHICHKSSTFRERGKHQPSFAEDNQRCRLDSWNKQLIFVEDGTCLELGSDIIFGPGPEDQADFALSSPL